MNNDKDEFSFIEIVNTNSDKRKRLEEAKRKSTITSKIDYRKNKKQNKSMFKLKAIALLLALGIGTSAVGLTVNNLSKRHDIYEESHNNAEFISSETYRVNNNQNYAYDNFGIAQKVTEYNGDRNIHAVIYSCYYVYSYDVLKQMNELFSNMHSLIQGHEDEYKEEIVDACNYASFDEYLSAMNFTTLDEYKEKMKDLLLAYSRSGSESEEVKNILDEIDNQGIDFGGR